MSIRNIMESFPNEDARVDYREYCNSCGRITESNENQCKICGTYREKETLLEKIKENKDIMEFSNEYPNHPKIIDFLEEKWDEFLSFDDAVKQVGQVFSVSEEDAQTVVQVVEDEMGKLVSVEQEVE